jgi:hypothetical protein
MEQEMIEEQAVATTVELPKQLWLEFRSTATLAGMTAKSALVEAIKAWLRSKKQN